MNCAIVPAAGRSRRMGAMKLLLPFGETTVIGHVVDELLKSAVDEVYVVVGHQGDGVAAELSGRGVRIVVNDDCQAGMLSSVRRGLEAIPAECETVLVALGDQPAITSELVDEMIRTFATTARGILAPVFRGKRGHPVLFAGSYRDEILTCHDEVGLRGLLRAHPEDVFEMAVSTSSVLSDLDTPEDYRRELRSHRR